MNFKEINIGNLISELVTESGIEMPRICNFMKCNEDKILEMYNSSSLDAEIILKWSKLLEYDFFRIYSQHLILYAPIKKEVNPNMINNEKQSVPRFRKNIYTYEIIDYLLNKINSGELKKSEVIKRYNIPKTTLYKWINKYNQPKSIT